MLWQTVELCDQPVEFLAEPVGPSSLVQQLADGPDARTNMRRGAEHQAPDHLWDALSGTRLEGCIRRVALGVKDVQLVDGHTQSDGRPDHEIQQPVEHLLLAVGVPITVDSGLAWRPVPETRRATPDIKRVGSDSTHGSLHCSAVVQGWQGLSRRDRARSPRSSRRWVARSGDLRGLLGAQQSGDTGRYPMEFRSHPLLSRLCDSQARRVRLSLVFQCAIDVVCIEFDEFVNQVEAPVSSVIIALSVHA